MLVIESNTLSKSQLLARAGCARKLHLNRYHPELRDDLSAAGGGVPARSRRGLARDLFPGGEDSSPVNRDYAAAVERTRELIKKGVKVIYEAAFLFNGILCLADILVKKGRKWKIYEVKSSTGLKDVYLPDAAVQYHVITGTGLAVSDVSIVYLNNQYVRQGGLDLAQLFTISWTGSSIAGCC